MNFDQVFQNHGIVNSLRDATFSPVQLWLNEHPIIYWFLSHPLGLGAIALLFILFFAGFISAISRLTENIWLAFLKLPFHFLQWLLRRSSGVFKWAIQSKNAIDITPQQCRLSDILSQLETLQQQQAELLEELRRIIGDRSDPPDSGHF
jgi:hypothetical protein